MTRSYTIPRNFRRVVRRILRHGTYTCCQLSYDVGQRVSIVARNRAWNRPSIFILYAKWKTPLGDDEPVDRRSESAAKSFTRIAPMCACGEEGAPTQRSTEKAPGPARQEWSSLSTGAEGPSITNAAQEGAGTRSPPHGGKASRRPQIGRPAADRSQVAIRVGARTRIRRARGRRSAQVVLHGPLPVHEWVPAPGVRHLVPPGREADCGERAEAVGDPPGDGHPRPGDPEIRGSDALDRGLPRRDDGRLESARGGRRLDAFLHHDAAQPAVRRVRALAVPPPQGRRLRADRQAPGDLVPEGPGADRGPRSPRRRRRDADGIHAAEVPPG